MKDPDRYESKEPSEEVPDPIKCDPSSLKSARTECRRGMTLILEEVLCLPCGLLHHAEKMNTDKTSRNKT